MRLPTSFIYLGNCNRTMGYLIKLYVNNLKDYFFPYKTVTSYIFGFGSSKNSQMVLLFD